ncbi:MAG: hypothetical protein JWQ44_2936 [Chthoniobacter sp.]|nr:hypothetical protein [Chthoniobacter sp.]
MTIGKFFDPRATSPLLLPKIRSESIMAAAEGMQCALRLPGICNHDSSTTVNAHLPGIGKSSRSKVSDLHSAIACAACHDAIDNHTYQRRGLTPAIVLDAMLRGHCETQARWVAMGLITGPDWEIVG